MSKDEAVTLVVGLGEVGKPLYTILKRQEPGAIGIDIDPASVDQPVGIMHICFPFHRHCSIPKRSGWLCLKNMPRRMIVINSTAVPGTTRGHRRSDRHPMRLQPGARQAHQDGR